MIKAQQLGSGLAFRTPPQSDVEQRAGSDLQLDKVNSCAEYEGTPYMVSTRVAYVK